MAGGTPALRARIEQGFRFLQRQPTDIRMGPAAEIQGTAAGFGMLAYDRMARARTLTQILLGKIAGAELSARAISFVMLDRFSCDPRVERGRESSLTFESPRS